MKISYDNQKVFMLHSDVRCMDAARFYPNLSTKSVAEKELQIYRWILDSATIHRECAESEGHHLNDLTWTRFYLELRRNELPNG